MFAHRKGHYASPSAGTGAALNNLVVFSARRVPYWRGGRAAIIGAVTGDDWLARRTFRGTDFDPEHLAHLKSAAGLSISVCLPTLNVADTVGDIVETVRREWMGPRGLVDEIAIVDSRSTDDTVRVAREAGAVAHRDDKILPELGPGTGKGEALWKSLAVLEGDVVLWLDSDVVDFDPAFVPGMLGPLLVEPDIGYVKAMYRRRFGDSDNGGRVTEICARPLINLFYGRRSLLESVPFFNGYAVELGLLIDIHRRAGVDAIAQVDLGERRHTNQPTAALGRMAYAISQAVLQRVSEEGRAPEELAVDPGPYRRPVSDASGEMVMSSTDVRPSERPPMASVPGYNARVAA
jgi:glucosyl-3-phosphoglycerate synthase